MAAVVCPTSTPPTGPHYYGKTNDTLNIPDSGWGKYTVGAGIGCPVACGTCPDSLPVEPVTQATALPACADIMVSGVVPSGSAGDRVAGTGISETECINHCSSQADCGSVSFNSGRSRCYTYNEEYKLTMRGNNYNYYPEKCQPS